MIINIILIKGFSRMNANPFELYQTAQSHRLELKPRYLSLCLFALMAAGASSGSFAEEHRLEKSKSDNQYNSLATITVYAQYENDAPVSRTSINRENMDQTGVTDMAGIVKYLPLVNAPFSVGGGGTFFDGTGTSSYNIRGIDANRIGLDVDGVDLADATVSTYVPPKSMSKRGAGRDYIEPEMFTTVDIVSGTTDVSTDGIGGRVSFKNKSPEDYLVNGKTVAGTVKAGYSSADQAWLSSVTGAVGNDDVKALVAYAHREGNETKPNSKTPAFPSDWTSDAVLTRLLWNLSDQHQLNFTADYYKKRTDTKDIAANLFSNFKSDARQHQDIDRTQFSILHTYKPNDFQLFDQLNSKLWYQESNNDTATAFMNSATVARDFSTTYKEKNTGLKIDAKKEFKNQKLKYGIAADKKEYASTKVDLRNGQTISSIYQGGYLLNSELKRYSAYASDEFSLDVLGRDLILTPAVRIERQEFRPEITSYSDVQAKDYNYVSPSFSASYQFTPSNYSYLKYSRGNRIPSPTEIGGVYQTTPGNPSYIVIGNSNLKKETSDAFELGLRNTSIDGIKFDVTGFYTKYKDFIDYYNYGTTPQYPYGYYRAENLADAQIWGGELSTRIDLGHFIPNSDGYSLALVAGKTKGSAKNKNGGKSGVNSVQPEKGSLTFAYDDPNKVFGLGMTATAVGGRMATKDVTSYQDDIKYQNVAGYTVFDLSAYWNVNKFTKLNVAFNNIFDKTYWDYAAVGTLTGANQASIIDRAAEPGRNVVASIEFKY